MTDLLKRIDEGLDKCGVTPGRWRLEPALTKWGAVEYVDVTNGEHVVFENTGDSPDASLIAQCREAFKALIKLTYLEYYTEYSALLENGWDDDESSHKALLSVAGYASIIESGTGWTWQEWRRWID